MPLYGDKKPDNWVPPEKATPELQKELEEAATKYPEDKKEDKDAEVRERTESDKN